MISQNRWNAGFNILGESFWGLLAALIASGTVLTIILRDFGAGDKMIGAIMTVEAVCFVFPQVLGLWLFRSIQKRKVQIVGFHLIFVIPFIFLSAAILMWSNHFSFFAVRWLMLFSYAAFAIFIGIAIAIWMDWLATIFPQAIRGTALGLSFGFAAFAGAGGTLLAGWIIKKIPSVQGFALLYGIAGILGVLAMISFFMLHDPNEKSDAAPKRFLWSDFITGFGATLKNKNARNFLFGRILMVSGFSVLPFITLYYLSAQGGALSKGTVVICSVAMTIGTGIANVTLGWLGDRHGHRSGLLAGAGSQIMTLIVILLVSGPVGCAIAYAGAGIVVAAGFATTYNMLYETCPYENRVVHIIAGNWTVATATAVLPILAGTLSSVYGLKKLFVVSLIISVVSLWWLVVMVKEPRKVEK